MKEEKSFLEETIKNILDKEALEKILLESEIEKVSKEVKIEETKLKIFIKECEFKVKVYLQEEGIEIKNLKNEFEKDLKVLETELLNLRKEKNENQILASGTIECPSCKHFFMPLSPKINFKDLCKKIDNLSEKINVKTSEIKNIKDGIVDLKKEEKGLEIEKDKYKEKINLEIKKEKERLENLENILSGLKKEGSKLDKARLLKLENQLRSLNWQLKLHDKIGEESIELKENDMNITQWEEVEKGLKKRFDENNSRIFEVEKEINKFSNLEILSLDLKNLSEKINFKKYEKEDLEKKLKEIECLKEKNASWLVRFKNFKTHLANKSISSINNYINYFLSEIGSNVSIRLEIEKEVGGRMKEEIETIVLRDGFNCGSYGKLSAGERGRIDIASVLTNQELINLEASGSGGGLDLLIFDEVFDSIDVKGLEKIMRSLDELSKTIIFISQNETNFDKSLVIKKENKISSIII
jgi:exonuclease SbcC